MSDRLRLAEHDVDPATLICRRCGIARSLITEAASVIPCNVQNPLSERERAALRQSHRNGERPMHDPGECITCDYLRWLDAPVLPRCFVLQRDADETGVSTAQGAQPGDVVAWGVEFPDGICVTRWAVSDIRQTCVWASLGDVLAVHGHEGKTRALFVDVDSSALETLLEERTRASQ